MKEAGGCWKQEPSVIHPRVFIKEPVGPAFHELLASESEREMGSPAPGPAWFIQYPKSKENTSG